MEIPLYIPPTEQEVSWKHTRTQGTTTQWGADHARDESYVSGSDDEAWASQTNGRAARLSSARGAITGVLLGAGLWGAILVLVGVIKL
jgi:hypothetical protein